MTMMIKVTAREGKPILIIEEGDAETAAWAQHSLEVVHGDDGFDNDVGGDGDGDGDADDDMDDDDDDGNDADDGDDDDDK